MDEHDIKLTLYYDRDDDSRVYKKVVEATGICLLDAAYALDNNLTEKISNGDTREFRLSDQDAPEFFEAMYQFAMCRTGQDEYDRMEMGRTDSDYCIVFEDKTVIEMIATREQKINQPRGK